MSIHGLKCFAHEDVYNEIEERAGFNFPDILGVTGAYCECSAVFPSFARVVTFLICGFTGMSPFEAITATLVVGEIVRYEIRYWTLLYAILGFVLLVWERIVAFTFGGIVFIPILVFLFYRSLSLVVIYMGIQMVLGFVGGMILAGWRDVTFTDNYLRCAYNVSVKRMTR